MKKKSQLLLELKGLSCRGIDGFDLRLNAGECAAFSGPSGCGKTSILRSIADLDPHQGQSYLSGESALLYSAPAWRKKVIYVAAEAAWWADDLLAHFKQGEQLQQYCEKLGLAHPLLSKKVRRLSSGERQRFALIRALLQSPQILLLDEPTSSLDKKSVAAVESLLQDFLTAGNGILLVSHDLQQTQRLAQTLFQIQDRKVKQLQ